MDVASIIAEDKIREAINNGEFENLPGQGKPVDLKPYFQAPPHLRMTYDILKKSNVVPDELQLIKQIQLLKEQREDSVDEKEKFRLRIEINFKTAQFNFLKERYRRR